MKKIKLRDANKQATQLIVKLVSKELDLYGKLESDLVFDEIDMLFLIRDCLKNNVLDPYKLEEYDDCYGIDLEETYE